jgi:UMF1 family MFS transporter
MPVVPGSINPASSVPPVTRRELFSWAMYDFANSGYTTVVLTAIFSAYFVGVVAGNGADRDGSATLLWTLAMAVSNGLILITAPVLGAIADARAWKKRFLLLTTIGCVLATALLALAGPGDVWLAMVLVIVSAYMFGSGENLIAAFLPEIATQERMGRISAYGWTLGYLGGLLVLGICLVQVTAAQARGEGAAHYVPVTMLITAAAFALAALPTFLWLRERAVPAPLPPGRNYLTVGFVRLRQTWDEAHRFRDLTRFLVTLALYQCGVYTVIVLAAVYAQEAMGFSTFDNIVLILVVNVTAALGAFGFGHIQDRLGSVPTLAMTLLLWIAALAIAWLAHERAWFWVAANFIGIAMGSSQSAGRALIGLFSPPERSAEFFGLWGFAAKLAAIVGPLCYGFITFATHGNHRLAVLATALFFVAGLVMLMFVNEPRGRAAALANHRA